MKDIRDVLRGISEPYTTELEPFYHSVVLDGDHGGIDKELSEMTEYDNLCVSGKRRTRDCFPLHQECLKILKFVAPLWFLLVKNWIFF